MTFLDAYYPFGKSGTSDIAPYGLGATWAEHYLDHRDNAERFLADTNRQLPLAYDFDVTAIDRRPLGTGSPVQRVRDLMEAHAWPYLWYGCVLDSSIVYDFDKPNTTDRRTCISDQIGVPRYATSPYGPKLALEYGKHVLPFRTYSATGRDPTGADLLCPLTTGLEACPTSSSTVNYVQTLNPTKLFQFAITQANVSGISPTGTVTFTPPVQLISGSPAWVQFRNTTTEPFDMLQLDYQFLSRGKGLLSVYVDDLMVFVAEEVDGGSQIQHTPLIPIGNLAPGNHTLAFRLDPQTTDQSIVQVSGIQTGTAKLVSRVDRDDDDERNKDDHDRDENRLMRSMRGILQLFCPGLLCKQ